MVLKGMEAEMAETQSEPKADSMEEVIVLKLEEETKDLLARLILSIDGLSKTVEGCSGNVGTLTGKTGDIGFKLDHVGSELHSLMQSIYGLRQYLH